jgi:hypothetical protein
MQGFLDRWYGADRKAVFPGKRVVLAIPGDQDHRSEDTHRHLA